MASLTRYSNTDLLELPDCGGLLENGKCRWLSVSYCIGAKCSYYKKTNDTEKARTRLQSLDEKMQERISRKYYGGSRPWADTEAGGGG